MNARPAAPPPDALALRRFAHELNAQLGVVLMAVSMQNEQIDDLQAALPAAPAPLPPLQDLREGALLAQASLQRCLQLVARTLHSDAPPLLAQPPQPLATTARLALAQQLHQVPHMTVGLQIDLPGDWHGDPLAWHQVFTNLVGNSLLHGFVGRGRGAIRIHGEQHADGLRVLDYRDDGVGVDAAIVERLFDIGFSTRLGSGGNGLGLGIVRQLLQQHLAGGIECLPAPAGAHFRIVFPAPAPARPPAFPSPS